MRKLASIQRVLNVRPIEGADKIEAVDVLGWTVVCKKGDFKAGDFAVYFEIDSWLDSSNPAFATFEERFTNWGTKRGMRLKTIKLRKQVSQGLLLKTSDFPVLNQHPRKEGDDVTEVLGIEKWEPAEESHGNAGGINKAAGAGKFPSFLRKTDQERVQNYINELPKHADTTFEVSIKLDGSSMTVYHVGRGSPHYAEIAEDIEKRQLRKLGKVKRLVYKLKKKFGYVKQPAFFQGVCSRNIELPIDEDNHFSQYVRQHDILTALEFRNMNIAVQGELIAPSIQNNYEKVDGFEFYVYDVFDIDAQKYLPPAAAREVARQLGLKYVPVLEAYMSLREFSLNPDPRAVVDEILAFAEGPGMRPGVKREGIVFKSNGSEFSFKAISNSYLLTKEKKAA